MPRHGIKRFVPRLVQVLRPTNVSGSKNMLKVYCSEFVSVVEFGSRMHRYIEASHRHPGDKIFPVTARPEIHTNGALIRVSWLLP